jgi:hypothetical protein
MTWGCSSIARSAARPRRSAGDPMTCSGATGTGRSPGSIRLGSCWRLNGDTLVALSENTATIATPTGGSQTYRRKLSEPDRVLAWELAA